MQNGENQNTDIVNPSEMPEELLHVENWEDTVCALQQKYCYERSFLAEKLCHIEQLKYRQRDPSKRKTIAAYYHSIHNGGAQRVVAQLCNIWAQMKDEQTGELCYRVLVVTDEKAGEDYEPDYPLVPQVKHLYVPKYDTKERGDYRPRFRRWQEIITEYEVDAVISSAWVFPGALWDMLAIKGHLMHPAYIIHCHNFMAVPFGFINDMALELIWRFRLSDGVVTLSECDDMYAKSFTNHSRSIMNPFTVLIDGAKAADCGNHNLIWCGRLASEKQPEEAVRMMKYLAEQIPDAKLYMVGNGSGEIQNQLEQMISQLGLSENVELVGFKENVDEYYKKASVFISTSEFEGMPLVFMEAMAHGLPVISYDMPWLTFMRENGGEIITVGQGCAEQMAQEAARLLQNPEICRIQGQKAKEKAQEYASADIGREWKQFLSEIDSGELPQKRERTSEEVLLYYLAVFQQKGKKRILEENNKLSHKICSLDEEKHHLKSENQRLSAREIQLEEECESLSVRISQLEKKIQKLSVKRDKADKRHKQDCDKIKTLEKKNKKLTEQMEKILESRTYKVGKILLYLPRKVKQLFSRKA